MPEGETREALIKAKTFQWGPDQERAFQEMRSLLASDAILAFPDHNLPFEIETDASDYQLGAVIKQNNRPVAYYSRKLNSAQKNYTTIEKELLSVVETLRTFRSMLLGARIKVFTDHKNLTHKLSSYSTQRVMRWRILIEEFGPTFEYKKGNENVIADAMSRVPTKDENDEPAMPETRCVKVDDLWTECLWAMPKFDERNRQPTQFETAKHYQDADPNVAKLLVDEPNNFVLKTFGKVPLVCRVATPDPLIVLSDDMLPKMVKWQHEMTLHSEGVVRLEASLRRHYWHPDLRKAVRTLVSNCVVCSRMKKGASLEGQLAPRAVPSIPWLEVHADCIGPWDCSVKGLKAKVHALTIIDPVTNLVEIVRIDSVKSKEVTTKFVNTWLSRYPKPERAVTDNGPEFVGHEWEFMLMDWGIKKANISSNTPTANAVIETVHRTMGQIIRTVFDGAEAKTKVELDALIDKAVAICIRACRCAANTSLQGVAPGALVFGRDMNLNIPIIADIIAILENRQIKTDKRLMHENKKRSHHEYVVGDFVYVQNHFSSGDKMKPAWRGPFKILQVHTNGTVTIERGRVHERISIRRLKPDKAPVKPSS